MYTDVIEVGEFDDLFPSTPRKRAPVALIIAPAVESLTTPTAPMPAADDSLVVTAVLTMPTSTDPAQDLLSATSPDLGFPPLPPITNFSHLCTVNCSCLDDELRGDTVPLTPINQSPHTEEISIVGTRYIASCAPPLPKSQQSTSRTTRDENPSRPNSDARLVVEFDSALPSACSCLLPLIIACFHWLRIVH
jgi:hypothetical protein